MTTTEQPSGAGIDEVADTDEVAAPARSARGTGESARRAYDRRHRRQQRVADPRLIGAGLPIRSALARVPIVVMSILVLGAGIAGVLAVNTRTDELGLQVNRVINENADLKLQREALEQQVAEGDSTPRIAQEARRLGMIPAADPAIITIDKAGGYTMIGTPTAQPGAAAPPAGAPAPATTPAPTTTPAGR